MLRAIPAARRVTRRTGFVILAILATLLAACGTVRTNDNPTSDAAPPGFMPGEVVTRQGAESASLYLPIFIVAVLVFVLVEGLVLYITFRFRRRATDTDLPPQTHGNNVLELTWTAIPFAVVLVMFVASFIVLTRVQATSEDPAVTVDATAFQWQWTFEYRDQGLSYTGAGKAGPEMVLPVDEPVRIRLHAQDVIHAFYVPAFFYKLDAVPGRTNEFEVVIEKPGTYGGQCAEFCGLAHGDMYFTVRAVERGEYDAWLAAEVDKATATPTPAPSHQGEVLRITTTADAPLAFDTDRLTATAGTTVTIEYLNDSVVAHNIQVFDGPDATAPMLAGTAIGTGPGNLQSVTFQVPDTPGPRFFLCQVHPFQMRGTFEVIP